MGTQEEQNAKKRIAVYLPMLSAGGAERVMLTMALWFADQGHPVDLVLANAKGEYLAQVPANVNIVDLGASRVLTSFFALTKYLRRKRPHALLSAFGHANVVAVAARMLARTRTRVILGEHTTVSRATRDKKGIRYRLLPAMMRWAYVRAGAIVAVSEGAADDLAAFLRLPREKIRVVYNPVVSRAMIEKSAETLDHPWFGEGKPPVILAVGRLTEAKDFPNLIRAFALLRARRPARLVILGEGEERNRLESLVRELQLESDVEMKGFVENPYRYMKRATVFVLSSCWEGLPTALIEAMAVGTPVVSTDCRSGPAEILEQGRWGRLVPVGDPKKLANAMQQTIDSSGPLPGDRAKLFTTDAAGERYLRIINERSGHLRLLVT